MQTAQVIPFNFEKHPVRATMINGDPWFVASDICRALNLSNTSESLRNLDSDEKGISSTETPSGTQEMLVVSESGLFTLILRCRDAVKPGTTPHKFRKWVTAEVLPAIRKTGRYEDSEGKMNTLIGQTIGTDGFHMLGAVIKGKVSTLPVLVQRRATAKIWSQTHAAFGVRSAADIPADQLDAARNFIAAYALEGEYLAKGNTALPTTLTPAQRFMVFSDDKGEQQIRPIPLDACVMTHRELIKAMVTPGEMKISAEEMFEFAMSALTYLKANSDYQSKQLQHLKSTR